MHSFRIVPLSRDFARAVKTSGVDDFGHPLIEQVATGKGPCRVSLRPFVKGHDRRLLLAHSPFEVENAFNQPGPIFIHKEDVPAYADIHRFPPEIKADKKSFPLTLIGYDESQMMCLSRLVGDDDVDELITRIFQEHSSVAYLHARNAAAGCFICRIERA